MLPNVIQVVTYIRRGLGQNDEPKNTHLHSIHATTHRMFFRFKGSKFLQLHPMPAESPKVFEIGQSDLIPLFYKTL